MGKDGRVEQGGEEAGKEKEQKDRETEQNN